MPILAEVVVDAIKEDESRYRSMIKSGELKLDRIFVHDGIGYNLYLGKDNYIAALANCRLIALFKGDDCVYSCYYKMAETPHFGKRVVQVEVRQSGSMVGLARNIMLNYFLKHYDSIRTDLSNTKSGLKMWQTFFGEQRHNLYFYNARINIDLRQPNGAINQDATCAEYPAHIRRVHTKELPVQWWHDNREGNVHVVYALKTPY